MLDLSLEAALVWAHANAEKHSSPDEFGRAVAEVALAVKAKMSESHGLVSPPGSMVPMTFPKNSGWLSKLGI